jgi:hypothetical protein
MPWRRIGRGLCDREGDRHTCCPAYILLDSQEGLSTQAQSPSCWPLLVSSTGFQASLSQVISSGTQDAGPPGLPSTSWKLGVHQESNQEGKEASARRKALLPSSSSSPHPVSCPIFCAHFLGGPRGTGPHVRTVTLAHLLTRPQPREGQVSDRAVQEGSSRTAENTEVQASTALRAAVRMEPGLVSACRQAKYTLEVLYTSLQTHLPPQCEGDGNRGSEMHTVCSDVPSTHNIP